MKHKYIILLLCGFLFAISGQMTAQVVIAPDTDTDLEPDADALLDLRSGGNKGLLLPRVILINTTDPSPLTKHEPGMVVYNTSESQIASGYYFNDGNGWVQITDTQVASWFSFDTKMGATSNTENIYQQGDVAVGSPIMEPHTKFQVASSNKGVLLPRLTTAQIGNITDGLSADEKKKIDGLMVYNTSTNCLTFFNGETSLWMSLCYEAPPAGMEIECAGSSDCRPHGTYKALTMLDDSNFYRIRIRVNEPGAYNVRITTTNGYSFTRSGTFNEVGIYTIDVPGLGIPKAGGKDAVTIFLNEQEISVSLPDITVENPDASYSIVCTDGKPGVAMGEYSRGVILSAEHYITIRIESEVQGTTTIETQEVNGILFRATNVALGAPGEEQEVKLQGFGTPQAIGTFEYNFAYATGNACPFTVTVGSKLGSFDEPAQSCLALLNEGFTNDGEYWIRQASSSTVPVKTFCDMTNGGWTLVWSYSEKTAYNTYSPDGMAVGPAYCLYQDVARNVVIAEGNDITYENYRLANATMRSAVSGTYTEFRVRIADDPKDMNDEWALNNYANMRPWSTATDPLTYGGGDYFHYYRATGKIWGIELVKEALDAGDPRDHNRYGTRNILAYPTLYQSGYANHLNFDHTAGPLAEIITIIPAVPAGLKGTTTPYRLNNTFGFFGEGEEANHHFGKCVDASGNGDDYDFTIDYCYGFYTTGLRLVPHSFNGGEGRYLQWWVK